MLQLHYDLMVHNGRDS